ncbi:hypothetical protein E2F43_16035 [Seongchinamella unica]|uniref:Outer membrane protein beta-barrel domain-containing protein n=1 Tax=Seongchinamella unica TaxID=2547392 RepID=A0A4R5LNJ7_9GAMM|nr:hypothetical protein [Seongchinamella unica]TDG11876.1 hypothetical protein E2F43_16035 [Seongchinamella unica]
MTRFLSFLCCALALAGGGVQADESSKANRGPWVWGVSGGTLHQFDTDLKQAEGSFSVNRGFLQLSAGYAWDQRNSASLSLGWGTSNYVFDDGARIEGLRPWKRIEDYRISLPVRFNIGERADFIAIPSIRSYAEAGASLRDGRTEGLIAGMGWRFSDTLTIGPGFGWYSELGGGSNAFPIVVVDWRITERLSLQTGRGLAASQGPGFTLAYQLNKRWNLSALARYEKIRFALDEGESGAAIGEDRSAPLLLSLDYSPWSMTRASLFVGAELNGELNLETGRGREIASSDYETAPLIGFSFRSRF